MLDVLQAGVVGGIEERGGELRGAAADAGHQLAVEDDRGVPVALGVAAFAGVAVERERLARQHHCASTSLAMVTMFWLRGEERPPVNRVVKEETFSLIPSSATFVAVSSGSAGFSSPVTSRPSAFGRTASRSRASAAPSSCWPGRPLSTTFGLPPEMAIRASFGGTSIFVRSSPSAARSRFTSTCGVSVPALSAVKRRLFAIALGPMVTEPLSVLSFTGAATAGFASSATIRSTSSAVVAGCVSTSGTVTGCPLSHPWRTASAERSGSSARLGFGWTAFGWCRRR